ncbi:MAG: hypothetical protein ACI4PC_07710 [Oscillospiraceae bacterium]
MSMKVIAGSWRKSFLPVGVSFTRSLSSAFLFILSLGIIAGGGVGVFSSVGGSGGDISLALSGQLPAGAWACLVSAGRFFLLAALFSTTYLGVLLMPALVFARGFVLCRAVSALFSAFSFRGLFGALLIYGVPALVDLPCFLIVGCACFESSRCLFMQRFQAMPPVRSIGCLRPLLLALVSIAFSFLYTRLLLPDLLARFF